MLRIEQVHMMIDRKAVLDGVSLEDWFVWKSGGDGDVA